MKARVNPKSTSNQSSKPCTVLQYPSTKEREKERESIAKRRREREGERERERERARERERIALLGVRGY